MFKRYFELSGEMPYEVDQTCGHIDRLISLTFGCTIEELDSDAILAQDAMFNKLCRIIMLTELLGMRQLDALLASPAVLSNKQLTRIFDIIRQDEPSHWQPTTIGVPSRRRDAYSKGASGRLAGASRPNDDKTPHALYEWLVTPTL